jgi:signal transduction histidine kinase
MDGFLGIDETPRAWLIWIIVLGASSTVIVPTILTRTMLGRVAKFIQEAEQMGEDDLSRRLHVEGKDEFAQLADTFNSLLDRLEAAFSHQADVLEQQRRFTADASHELKTPLTTIKGTASMALVGSVGDDRSRAAFTEIDRASDVMVRLVYDLLYLARADAGALPSERQQILAIEVLERAKEAVDHLEGGAVHIDSDNFDAKFWGCEPELIKLFTNLLSNARRHTPPPGEVRVSTTTGEDMIEVVVADDGCGISPEHLCQLGQRFYRVDASRSRVATETAGTGLGLAIVKEIVKAHLGTIDFQSTIGIGTTVTVRIPSSIRGD